MTVAWEELTTLPNEAALLKKANEVFDGKLLSVDCTGRPGRDQDILYVTIGFTCDLQVLTETLRKIPVNYDILLEVVNLVGDDDGGSTFHWFEKIRPAIELLSGKNDDYTNLLKLETWLMNSEDDPLKHDGDALHELRSLQKLFGGLIKTQYMKADKGNAFIKAVDDFFKVGDTIRAEIQKIIDHIQGDFNANLVNVYLKKIT